MHKGQTIKFKDFVTLQRGFDLPRRERIPGDYPVIASTSIAGTHNQYKVAAPGVVTGRSGSLGTVQYIAKPFWPLNTTLWVKDFKGNLPKYVYYFLQMVPLEHFNSGAGVPTLNRNHLDEIEIYVHSLPVQRKIAAILSAYDDLIENNTRRIAILEEMAQLLYREWFVHFRFPGHEDVGRVDSELGPLPEGWGTVELREVSKINRSNLKKSRAPKVINYVTIGSVNEGQIEEVKAISYEEAPSRARRIVQHGDIIWTTVRPNLKSYALVLDPLPNMIVSTGFVVITPREVPYSYLYQALTTDQFVGYLTNLATGAAYPAVKIKDFKKAEILRPLEQLLNEFHQIAENFYEQKCILQQKNGILRQARDLMLPRLLSGDLDVSNLAIDTVPLTV